MPYGWEGNRRSGVALTMRYRHMRYIYLRPQWPKAGRWAPGLRTWWVWHPLPLSLLFLYLYRFFAWFM